jgi:hypothetical protein
MSRQDITEVRGRRFRDTANATARLLARMPAEVDRIIRDRQIAVYLGGSLVEGGLVGGALRAATVSEDRPAERASHCAPPTSEHAHG